MNSSFKKKSPEIIKVKVYHGPGEGLGSAGYIKEGTPIKITGIKHGIWYQFEYKEKSTGSGIMILNIFNRLLV